MPLTVELPEDDYANDIETLYAFCAKENIEFRTDSVELLLSTTFTMLKNQNSKGDFVRVVKFQNGKVCKLVDLTNVPRYGIKTQLREVLIMAKFAPKSPHLLALTGLFFDKSTMQLGIEMNAMDSLEQLCAKMHEGNQNCTGAAAANCLWQLLNAVEKLAEFGFLHGDIKADNVLVTKNDEKHLVFIVSDFGSAREIESLQDATDAYGVPEPIHVIGMYHPNDSRVAKEKIDTRYDNWALGILILKMILKEHPIRLLKQAQGCVLHEYAYTIILRDDELDIVAELKPLISKHVNDSQVLSVLANMLRRWELRYTAKQAREELQDVGMKPVHSLSEPDVCSEVRRAAVSI